MKNNLILLIISSLLGLVLAIGGFVLNEKINRLNRAEEKIQYINEIAIPELKVAIAEMKVKSENDQSQKFDRYEEILTDLQKRLK